MSVSYHNSWDQYGINMASIWLRYDYLESHIGIIWELSGNLGTIFFELLNRFWIPVSFSCVNIQQKQVKAVEFGEYFVNSVKYLFGH